MTAASPRSFDEVDRLRAQLFAGVRGRLYAILDGARSPRVHELVAAGRLAFASLYERPLVPRLERAAPHVVELSPDAGLSMDLLAHGWGRSWGVYAESDAPLDELRQHLRGLLRVIDPRGRKLLFRFYDPRVLRIYLPTCTRDERGLLFGPITRFLCEDARGEILEWTR